MRGISKLWKNQHTSIQCIKLIILTYVLQQTVRQNVHFFQKCRCYLLLFTELCMSTKKKT